MPLQVNFETGVKGFFPSFHVNLFCYYQVSLGVIWYLTKYK